MRWAPRARAQPRGREGHRLDHALREDNLATADPAGSMPWESVFEHTHATAWLGLEGNDVDQLTVATTQDTHPSADGVPGDEQARQHEPAHGDDEARIMKCWSTARPSKSTSGAAAGAAARAASRAATVTACHTTSAARRPPKGLRARISPAPATRAPRQG